MSVVLEWCRLGEMKVEGQPWFGGGLSSLVSRTMEEKNKEGEIKTQGRLRRDIIRRERQIENHKGRKEVRKAG